MAGPYHQIPLPRGGIVKINDLTRVYFGDYYLVKLEIRCEIPVAGSSTGLKDVPSRTSPDCLTYVRYLQQMGVPSAEIETVKLALLHNFERNSLPYILSEDFPAKLLASRQKTVTKAAKTYMEKKL